MGPVQEGDESSTPDTGEENVEQMHVAVDRLLPRGIEEQTRRQKTYERRWSWTAAFWVWMLAMHAVGILLFTNGFLLTRMVLPDKSTCSQPPIDLTVADPKLWHGHGTVDGGCWHPRSFEKAVIILIDALRYDFTVPAPGSAEKRAYHNALTYLYESAVESPNNAFLRPFIADPPTTTLQRLKGLTTGTLPTFIDIGSNFAGTAIDEDNVLMQLHDVGKKIAHLGDDTWWSLFPGYFEPNISRAYDSFNVWDLHTLDNGVLEHIFPLMKSEKKTSWDLLIGHFLGVDHAGHRYGPDHPAMNAKLKQMDQFIRDISAEIDEDTVLIVMGDHGMDSKGDHGGESDDEVEAALWMYSKRPFFGRTNPEYAIPPATAKIHPVNQIDLVPTLALLLGIPIPYNNLGRPIEEAFIGPDGTAWNNLAGASRVAAAGTKRYQASYFAARGLTEDASSRTAHLWQQAEASTIESHAGSDRWADTHGAFSDYQEENLRVCKSLWARFDIPKMITGIVITALGLAVLLLHASRVGRMALSSSEASPELLDAKIPIEMGKDYLDLHSGLVFCAIVGAANATTIGLVLFFISFLGIIHIEWVYVGALACAGSLVSVIQGLDARGRKVQNLLPSTVWGWLAAIFTISQSVGFAANSFTIWEDSILLFFLSTFGFVAGAASFRLRNKVARATSLSHSILFVVLGRISSISKFCREEQMPYCKSTYYASDTSSTSSMSQLAIPFFMTALVPIVVTTYLRKTQSLRAWGKVWVDNGMPVLLCLCAMFWLVDAADNGSWLPELPESFLKHMSVYVALAVLAIVFILGSLLFGWAGPLITWSQSTTAGGEKQTVVEGYANALGGRYLLLPSTLLVACVLLSKPMGGGALCLMLWQVLSLLEILHAHNLSGASSPIGPTMLALLGNFHYFTTGHQAVLSTIQWDAAFIPLFTLRMPWSALVLTLNHFAGQILAVACVPLLTTWLAGPRRKGVLEGTSRALAAFVAYFATETLATMAWAGHLRRHLMLYRVFSPRFMMAAAVLLVVDVVGILVALMGTRVNSRAIGDIFGYPE